ncbi:MAG: glucose-6-phosphate dehydrogenase assembly protein OpcA [Sulfobacillus sp.]
MAIPKTISWSADNLDGPSLLKAMSVVVPEALGGTKPVVATVLTLGLYVKGASSPNWALMAQELGKNHPCRILVINPASPSGAARVDVTISATIAERPGAETPILFSECIEMNLKGSLSNHWIDFLQPLVRSGLPAYLWWLGRPPDPDFRWDLLSASGFTHLVLNTADHDWREWLPSLKNAIAHQMRVDDLSWQRFRDLRHHWAQLADTPEILKILVHVQSIEISLLDPACADWVWWLAWLASRFGWSLVFNAEQIPVELETDLGPVPIHLRSGPATTFEATWKEFRVSTTITSTELHSSVYQGHTRVSNVSEHRVSSTVQEDLQHLLNRGHDMLFSSALIRLLDAQESQGGLIDA